MRSAQSQMGHPHAPSAYATAPCVSRQGLHNMHRLMKLLGESTLLLRKYKMHPCVRDAVLCTACWIAKSARLCLTSSMKPSWLVKRCR